MPPPPLPPLNALLFVKSHPVTVAVPELYIAPPYNDIYPSSVSSFVCSFVHASVIISQERKEEEGSKSTRPTEARQGQQLRENRNSPNQERPSRRNEQTNHNQACHLHPEIHHSWVCMYPLSSCVRPFVRWLVGLCMRQSSYHKRERRRRE